MTIFKVFTFEAAHRLPNVPALHKCGRLHGHSYRIELHVAGSALPPDCMVMDFAELKRLFAPTLEKLDHHYLNDFIVNPTAEEVVRWVWNEVKPHVPGLCQIVLHETCTAGAIYRGDGWGAKA